VLETTNNRLTATVNMDVLNRAKSAIKKALLHGAKNCMWRKNVGATTGRSAQSSMTSNREPQERSID
jgi:hypothetical protein